jgi:gp16 family phage-associated protein
MPRKQHDPQKSSAETRRLDEVQAAFEAAGVTVSGWARAHGFKRMAVVDVLRGKRVGRSGEAHRVAVALGLKAGTVITDLRTFAPAANSPAAPATAKRKAR